VTRSIDSAMMREFILDVPHLRSSKTIGISTILPAPRCTARKMPSEVNE